MFTKNWTVALPFCANIHSSRVRNIREYDIVRDLKDTWRAHMQWFLGAVGVIVCLSCRNIDWVAFYFEKLVIHSLGA